jgi:uncharacterized FlgJ-related protein
MPSQHDIDVALALEKWFNETNVTYQGVTRRPRLIKYGAYIVAESKSHRVPMWLMLGQCWRESQWFTTGLSIDYNCGFGIKDVKGKWGVLGTPPLVKGFSNYTSVGVAISAYFELMDSNSMPYRKLIDGYLNTRNVDYIFQALDIYAPASENDTKEHHEIVMLKKKQCQERGIVW